MINGNLSDDSTKAPLQKQAKKAAERGAGVVKPLSVRVIPPSGSSPRPRKRKRNFDGEEDEDQLVCPIVPLQMLPGNEALLAAVNVIPPGPSIPHLLPPPTQLRSLSLVPSPPPQPRTMLQQRAPLDGHLALTPIEEQMGPSHQASMPPRPTGYPNMPPHYMPLEHGRTPPANYYPPTGYHQASWGGGYPNPYYPPPPWYHGQTPYGMYPREQLGIREHIPEQHYVPDEAKNGQPVAGPSRKQR